MKKHKNKKLTEDFKKSGCKTFLEYEAYCFHKEMLDTRKRLEEFWDRYYNHVSKNILNK